MPKVPMPNLLNKLAANYASELYDALAERLDMDPSDKEESVLILFYTLLGLVEKDKVSLEDVHDAWSIWTAEVVGDEDHDSLLPFDELDHDTQELDREFAEDIQEAVEEIKTSNVKTAANVTADDLIDIIDAESDPEDPSPALQDTPPPDDHKFILFRGNSFFWSRLGGGISEQDKWGALHSDILFALLEAEFQESGAVTDLYSALDEPTTVCGYCFYPDELVIVHDDDRLNPQAEAALAAQYLDFSGYKVRFEGFVPFKTAARTDIYKFWLLDTGEIVSWPTELDEISAYAPTHTLAAREILESRYGDIEGVPGTYNASSSTLYEKNMEFPPGVTFYDDEKYLPEGAYRIVERHFGEKLAAADWFKTSAPYVGEDGGTYFANEPPGDRYKFVLSPAGELYTWNPTDLSLKDNVDHHGHAIAAIVEPGYVPNEQYGSDWRTNGAATLRNNYMAAGWVIGQMDPRPDDWGGFQADCGAPFRSVQTEEIIALLKAVPPGTYTAFSDPRGDWNFEDSRQAIAALRANPTLEPDEDSESFYRFGAADWFQWDRTEPHPTDYGPFQEQYDMDLDEYKKDYRREYKRQHQNRFDEARRRAEGKWPLNNTEKRQLIDQYAGFCYYCSRPETEVGGFHIDHLVPVTKGGNNLWVNLVPACTTCNTAKGNKSVAEFMAYRDRDAEKPDSYWAHLFPVA